MIFTCYHAQLQPAFFLTTSSKFGKTPLKRALCVSAVFSWGLHFYKNILPGVMCWSFGDRPLLSGGKVSPEKILGMVQ